MSEPGMPGPPSLADELYAPAGPNRRLRMDLELRAMERRLCSCELEHPGAVDHFEVGRLRYALSLARLDRISPGAALEGPGGGRPDLELGDQLSGFSAQVQGTLEQSLSRQSDSLKALKEATARAGELAEAATEARYALLDGGELTGRELDAEVGHRKLVTVAGGGGGSGYVYIGTFKHLDEAGMKPSYIIGSSFGALVGAFRAKAVEAPWDEYIEFAKGLSARRLFSPVPGRRRHGLPGLIRLDLKSGIGDAFDGGNLRIDQLAIPYDAVVAGVTMAAWERLPERFRRARPPGPNPGKLTLGRAFATRMWQVALFFDPRVTRPLILGCEMGSERLPAIDGAGFSAAIPGVLSYESDPGNEEARRTLDSIIAGRELAGLVDGGVVANVPCELAYRKVLGGRIGSRNTLIVGFDSFHPRWNPAHLWLQPITQAIQLQMTRNSRFADLIVRCDPTLSPVNVVPGEAKLAEAIGWGANSVAPYTELIAALTEPCSLRPLRTR